jgi:hypothetical protein
VDEVQKIKDRLVAARSKLLAAVAGLDEAKWDWPPGDGRWVATVDAGPRGFSAAEPPVGGAPAGGGGHGGPARV